MYYQDRKIAGILIENDITGQFLTRSIVGIGININQEVFVSEAPNPISLKQITGKETDLNHLLQQVFDSILDRYKQLKNGAYEIISKEYHSVLYRNDGFYPYRDQENMFYAKIQSVDSTGCLHLIDKSGETKKYVFKSVCFV